MATMATSADPDDSDVVSPTDSPKNIDSDHSVRSESSNHSDESSDESESERPFTPVKSAAKRKREKKILRKNSATSGQRPSRHPRQIPNGEGSYHLHFLPECTMTIIQKREWTDNAIDNLKEKIALINGNKRVYIIVESPEVAELLTTEGFQGIKLVRPTTQYTKVIIKNYPLYANPEIFFKNNDVKWVKRIKKFGKETKNLVAGMTGEIPELIANYPENWTSNQYACEKFEETPFICLKCSKWNH